MAQSESAEREILRVSSCFPEAMKQREGAEGPFTGSSLNCPMTFSDLLSWGPRRRDREIVSPALYKHRCLDQELPSVVEEHNAAS